MRVIIVSDAWTPQVNGVVRTLQSLKKTLEDRGDEVQMVTPDLFKTVPCPTYPEIRLAMFPRRRVARLIEQSRPCAIHIATEGPLGLAARNYCRKRRIPFTTAFHTRFPEYVNARFGVSTNLLYKAMRWFHSPSQGVMVAAPSLRDELRERGFANVRNWTRGIDLEQFRPGGKEILGDIKGPILLYVGRVAVEKNIEAFLATEVEGTKVVVGDGPLLSKLKTKYPDVVFAGMKHGEELAAYYAAADVFVFPSRTDTFGLVVLEALASGVPVAAYPVTGPQDVIGDAPVGSLQEDLKAGIEAALKVNREQCREFARDNYSWGTCTDQFRQNLSVFDPSEINAWSIG